MPAAKTIVVISDRQDAHIPYVQRHLSQEMVVLDPQTLLECHELTYATEGNRVVVIYGEQRLESVKSDGIASRARSCPHSSMLPKNS